MLAVLALAPADALLVPLHPTRHRTLAPAASRAFVSLVAVPDDPVAVPDDPVAVPVDRRAEGAVRSPYILSGLPRPRYRGSLMGFLHRTKLWYALAVAYVCAALRLSASSSVPLTNGGIALRVVAALITSANVFISDAYHNGDQKGAAAYTLEHELTWMRWDYIGISAILAHNQWLWSSNAGFAGGTGLASAYSAVCLATVTFLAPRLSGDRDSYGEGSTKVVKYITGTQFLPALTYLVLVSPVKALLPAWGVIYVVFGFGLVLYLSKKPQARAGPVVPQRSVVLFTSDSTLPPTADVPEPLRASTAAVQSTVHGFHEWFHLSVVLGHLSSMAFDLRDIARPVARVAGPWLHNAAPFNLPMLPWALAPWVLLFAMLPQKRRIKGKLSQAFGGGASTQVEQ